MSMLLNVLNACFSCPDSWEKHKEKQKQADFQGFGYWGIVRVEKGAARAKLFIASEEKEREDSLPSFLHSLFLTPFLYSARVSSLSEHLEQNDCVLIAWC